MILSVVAHQVRETILDYLHTTFSLADPAFERALFGSRHLTYRAGRPADC